MCTQEVTLLRLFHEKQKSSTDGIEFSYTHTVNMVEKTQSSYMKVHPVEPWTNNKTINNAMCSGYKEVPQRCTKYTLFGLMLHISHTGWVKSTGQMYETPRWNMTEPIRNNMPQVDVKTLRKLVKAYTDKSGGLNIQYVPDAVCQVKDYTTEQ
jgi:hypothetical protein